MKSLYIVLLLLIIGEYAISQDKVLSVSGTVLSYEGKGLEGVVVTLLKAKDSSVSKSAVTNNKGVFEFNHIAAGEYLIGASAVGYRNYLSAVINIQNSTGVFTLSPVTLITEAKQLGDVTVTAKKQFIENKMDKTVVNVDASPTNTGLSAMEVLEKSPGITIDNDDNISLKGKQGVVILIDGKPSYLSGKDLANYLRSLPANQLDQLEIMTQPSAKYDASGNSGVINIKTKKSKMNGFNATVSSTAIFAKYFKNTNSVTFNLRKDKWNVFGNYGYSRWEGFNDFVITRAFRKDAATPFNRYNEQNTYGKFHGYPHNIKLGADFFASKKTTLGIVYTGTIENRDFKSDGVSKIYDSLKNFVQYNTATTENIDKWRNNGINLNFRQVLNSKGDELTADVDYVKYTTKNSQTSNNYLFHADGGIVVEPGQLNPYLLKGSLPSTINIYSVKVDYTRTLPKDAKLEAGIKSSYVETDNEALYQKYDPATKTWLGDADRSNHFIYKENINAAYVNLNKQVKKLGIQLGLRAEQTVAKGNQVVKSITFKRNYTQVFPTAYFTYKLNDNNTVGLNYGRRIERPSYQDLNPFQFLLDRYTYNQGNPMLQPQFSYNIELSYNYKGQLNIAASYNYTSDIINDVIKIEPDGDNYKTFQTGENIASRKSYGFSANYNRPLTKWWTLNAYAGFTYNRFKGMVSNEWIEIGSSMGSFNLNNQFTLGKGWTGELNGFYETRRLENIVIDALPLGQFALGVGKQILDGKGNIRVNIRDPFWLMKFRGITDLNQFTANLQTKWDNRRFIVSFTYRFGKKLQSAQRKNTSNDILNRINSGGQQ